MRSFRVNPRLLFVLIILCVFAAAAWFFWNKKSNPIDDQISGVFSSISFNELVIFGSEGQSIIKFDDKTIFVLVDKSEEGIIVTNEYLMNESLPSGIAIFANDFEKDIAGNILIMLPEQNVSGIIVSFNENILTIRDDNDKELKVLYDAGFTQIRHIRDSFLVEGATEDLQPGIFAIISDTIISKGQIVARTIELYRND